MIRFRRVSRHPARRLGLLLACALLGACGALPDKPMRAVLYDFGPGARAVAAAGSADQPAIRLGQVDAVGALDNTAVLYRLAYTDAQQLQPYSQARWTMPPAQLLRQRLRQSLAQQQPVLRDGDVLQPGNGAMRLLQLELDEFSQVFDTPGSSVGLVRVHATVLSAAADGSRLLAQRSFVAQRPAPSPDAAGGVHALTAATDGVLAEISQWLATLR